ncbi:uncharacterized protein METZ01_LOCUS400332, partial [marine metagenome]
RHICGAYRELYLWRQPHTSVPKRGL